MNLCLWPDNSQHWLNRQANENESRSSETSADCRLSTPPWLQCPEQPGAKATRSSFFWISDWWKLWDNKYLLLSQKKNLQTIILPRSVVLKYSQFTPQGTYSNAWEHFWLSQVGGCYRQLVEEARDASKHRIKHPWQRRLTQPSPQGQ